jgi:TRAP transporter 4TM/12TM fusion protein
MSQTFRDKHTAMIFKFLLIAAALFAIYANVFALMAPIVLRGVFLGFISMAVFLRPTEVPKNKPVFFLDLFLAILSGLCTLLLVLRWEEFTWGLHDPTQLELAAGIVMIFLVLEACRRIIGWFLVGMTIFFLLYSLFGDYAPGIFQTRGYEVSRLVHYLFWDTTGIYGLPMYIAASYVVLFVIFGALLLRCGGERWFMDLSYAAVGRIRGGPALTAVLSSAFFGMLSGSPVANVVTTGSFTIPLMKEIGYEKHTAGAIEAVASTAGMFTPPIMGAAAFIMAEYLQVPYIEIAVAAAIPAFLFYFSIMSTVYIKAVKNDIPKLPKDRIPNLVETLKNYGHLMPPIFLLVYLMLSGWSLMLSAFYSIVSLIVLASLRKLTRMSVKTILEGLGDAMDKAIPVVVACAAAGIIYGAISMTGVGFKLSSALVALAGGSKFMVMVLSGLSAILLGFAIPPTASYVIMAALIVPSLLEIGLVPLAAHMFIFIFCCIGPITPPVALAAYSAAGIADSAPNKTGYAAFMMGMAAYIIPFFFVYNTHLLFVGSKSMILASTLVALVCLGLLVISVEGFFIRRLSVAFRGALIAAGALVFYVGTRF